jgi:hypothetical protein
MKPNGLSLTFGILGGFVLAATVQKRLGSAQVLDRARVRDLAGRLGEWTRDMIEAAGDDPDDDDFDPNVYSFSHADLEQALGVPVLGFGYSRVAVRIAPGVVAKLPWRYDGTLRSESEYNAWSEADDEVRAMMLPPLDYVYPPGVIVFPEVESVAKDTRAEGRLSPADAAALRAAQEDWLHLVQRQAPGALTRDVYGAQNWGRYDGRLVLLDYEDEGSFNKRTASPQKKRAREALRGAARAGRPAFPAWIRDVAKRAGYRSGAALARALPHFPLHDRWYDGVAASTVAAEIRATPGAR